MAAECDSILLQTMTTFGWRDRIRILFGKKVTITSWGIDEKVDKPDVLEALRVVDSKATVAPLWLRRGRVGGFVVEQSDGG